MKLYRKLNLKTIIIEAPSAPQKFQQTFASGVLKIFRDPVFLDNFKEHENMTYTNYITWL